MAQNPLISVLMPAYNAGKYIHKAIESILKQSHSNLELIIADDASSDNTRKIIDSFSDSRIKTFHNDINLGYLKTWNKIIAMAGGDFITFQDADDYSHPQRFEILLKEFEKDDELGVCGSNFIRVDTNNNVLEYSNFSLNHKEIYDLIPEKYDFIGSGLMIRRKVYDDIGGYNEYFDRIGAEDFYWVLLIMEKYKMKNIEDHLYFYRFHPHSVSGNWSDNTRKIHNYKLVRYLFNYRKEKGYDPLSTNSGELEEYIRQLNIPYEQDPSLFYREMSSKYFYEKNPLRCLYLSLKAIEKNIVKFENYRNFQYFLRLILIQKVKSLFKL